MGLFGSKNSIKVQLNNNLRERLTLQAKRSGISLEVAAERLLERYLPNLTGSFTRVLESLPQEDRKLVEESFYTVVFLVSYADGHTSMMESFVIEKQLKYIEESFGELFVKHLSLPKDRKDKLFGELRLLFI